MLTREDPGELGLHGTALLQWGQRARMVTQGPLMPRPGGTQTSQALSFIGRAWQYAENTQTAIPSWGLWAPRCLSVKMCSPYNHHSSTTIHFVLLETEKGVFLKKHIWGGWGTGRGLSLSSAPS